MVSNRRRALRTKKTSPYSGHSGSPSRAFKRSGHGSALLGSLGNRRFRQVRPIPRVTLLASGSGHVSDNNNLAICRLQYGNWVMPFAAVHRISASCLSTICINSLTTIFIKGTTSCTMQYDTGISRHGVLGGPRTGEIILDCG